MNDRVRIAEFDDVFAACVKLAERYANGNFMASDQETANHIEEQLRLLWSACAKLVRAKYAIDITTEVDREHPGYLILTTGDFRVYFPFFLISDFPRGELLDRICRVAQLVRVGQDATICISGSSCYLGTGIPAADLDFCEYVSEGDPSIASGLLSAMRRADTDAVCYKVRIDSKNAWVRPWDVDFGTPSKKLVRRLGQAMSKSLSRRLTFVTDIEPLGVLEATNVLLRLDAANTEMGDARGSFAVQEAPILGGAWIPRTLTGC